jgi:ferredoxin
VFNLSKLKTHSFMSMTGAVKNCFGVIPGYTKPGYHAKLKKAGHFADMLLDLSGYLSPRLNIMDAVTGMMGEGPHAGEPVSLGYLMASTSPLALDVVAAAIMGLPAERNPLLMAARQRNLNPTRLEEIDLQGIKPEQLRYPGFKLPSTLASPRGLDSLPRPVRKLGEILLKNAGSLKPVISKERCTGCGTCRKACPQKVIELIGHKARIRYQNCIRCYCCHEMCPENAIYLQAHWLHRLINQKSTTLS